MVKARDFHEPVLVDEVVSHLIHDRSGTYLDGTAGGGGHAQAIVQQLDREGRLVALDLDEEAVDYARR
ncbi:MAG: 16S rRNA (cytosine(1402)-N(4))-methyltransferase, partial [Calditrichaeota bacterium]